MKTVSRIGLKRYSTLGQISLKSCAEFGASSWKAAFRNSVYNIIIISLSSRSVLCSEASTNLCGQILFSRKSLSQRSQAVLHQIIQITCEPEP